ncbi:hypothetical protein J4438_02580 [Candidatus Woesearchaeota archaeon]|nr:hypothetical protein [Candidatus Woesearchaeota archaeon]
MATENIDGKCVICDTEYIVKKITHWDDGYGEARHEWQSCPSCKYNPQLMDDIRKSLEIQVEMTLSHEGKPKINSKVLSEHLVDLLKRYWPS